MPPCRAHNKVKPAWIETAGRSKCVHQCSTCTPRHVRRRRSAASVRLPLFGDARGHPSPYGPTMPAPPRIASILLLALVALIAAALADGRPVPGAASCPMTPGDSFWHADVSSLPVHPQSAAWISSIGGTAGLKADFGAGQWNGGPIGIPYATVPGTQPRVPVSFTYADESNAGPYPIPPNAPIEGGSSSSGDRHVLLVDRDSCRLWELYSAYPQNGGASWTAGSGATWDLGSNAMRPLGWTSGDAAGLPILPGLSATTRSAQATSITS